MGSIVHQEVLMKRIISLILALLTAWALCPLCLAEDTQVSLEWNPSTGYSWKIFSSDETAVLIEDDGIVKEETDLVGAPTTASFRIRGIQAGETDLTFTYARPWETEAAPNFRFTLPVTVDEARNVRLGGELTLFREEGTGWAFEMKDGAILELTDEGGEEEDQRFTLRPLADGQEEITFTRFSGEGQLPGALTLRLEARGDHLTLRGIDCRTGEAAFSPAFTFSTVDFDGNTVTEQVFAGHSLTILNFWEPWCGPCVSEMPFLEQLSQEYAQRGVQVIGIFATPNADEDVRAVLDKNGVTYPILRYVRAFDSLQTGYVPTTVILDGTGSIVCKPFSGSMNYASWCALVEELL